MGEQLGYVLLGAILVLSPAIGGFLGAWLGVWVLMPDDPRRRDRNHG